jgi:4-amino-4-deoxy-L-arabinose transferase-like glycosyltransferase
LITRAVGERQALWLIVAFATIGRLATLSQPMRYDESVTWAYFVGRPWSTVVSSYQFPNNHVFFSLLAKATSALAPFEPWALRLPAFIAGVAIVPLTWAVGRRFATPTIGLLGAALAAGSTTLMLYSTNARGYSLVTALFLVLLLLADELRTSQRVAHWAAFAVLGALGLYTIPVMLYPLGVVCTWLLLAAAREQGTRRWRLVMGVVLASAAAGVLALLLYLPIIRSAGLAALAGNRFVSPSSWMEFVTGLPRHAAETLLAWTSPLPWWFAPVLLVAAIAGMAPSGRSQHTERASLAMATALWCGFLLVVTHRIPFVRVWLFLLPLFLLAVARGIVRLAQRLRSSAAPSLPPWPAAALAALMVTVALVRDTVRASSDTGKFASARAMTDAIASDLRPGDRVLAPIPTNGPLLYYFASRGLDTALLNTPPEQTRRAFLVLDPSSGRTLDWAVSVGMIDPAAYREPALVLRGPDVELWRSERR